MRQGPSPRVHVFVCANRREGSPLGPGCGAAGDAVYDALKREVNARGLTTSAWVTKTHCLGVCPAEGATVARYAGVDAIRADVHADDAAALLDDAIAEVDANAAGPTWDALERELLDIEGLQTKKVLDLARRLKPNLTREDIQNPHDFPELSDPDWHYADGILTGVQSVVMALRALKNRGV